MTKIKRENKILGIIKDNFYTDYEYELFNWQKCFKFLIELRNKIADEDAKGIHLAFCPYCDKPIRLNFRQHGHPYFSHKSIRDAQECISDDRKNKSICQEIIRARKYEGRRTGQLHNEVIDGISQLIIEDKDCSLLMNPNSNRLYHKDGSKKYRIPDIYFSYKNKEIVIEVQNSPEWINYIAERQQFYTENNIYLIWVFTTSKLIENSLTSIDISYRQKYNTFLFDLECYKYGIKLKKLCLKCSYINVDTKKENDIYRTVEINKSKIIKLSELNYPEQYIPYYFDYNSSLNTSNHYCKKRNDVERELKNIKKSSYERTYYLYILESGYFSEYLEFPYYVKQNEISRLNHIATCFIGALFLFGALKETNSLKDAFEFDKKGTLANKMELARNFWIAVKNNSISAIDIFNNNKRMSEPTLKWWEKTIKSEDNKFELLFPELGFLNAKALNLIKILKKRISE